MAGKTEFTEKEKLCKAIIISVKSCPKVNERMIDLLLCSSNYLAMC